MRKIIKRRFLAMSLSIALAAGGSGAALAAEETDFSEVSPAEDVFVQGMAETEVLLQEEFGTEITDGTQYAVPSISEWKAGASTAELLYQGGRVYYKQTASKTGADMILPLSKGHIGGGEPAAEAAPATDIYVETDWKAGNSTARLYIMGISGGKQVQLFYLNQSGSTLRYTDATSTSHYAGGKVSMKQTDSHVVRLLLKRSGDTYTLAKTWIDGQLDVDTTLNASASCEGLYCLKTDERMNAGAGNGSSFGSLRVWQTAETQLKQCITGEGGSPDFEKIKGGNAGANAVTGDLTLETNVLTDAGLLVTKWESSNPDVIAADGTVIRPGDEDAAVTLTPTLAIRDVLGDGGADFQPVTVSAPGTPISVTVLSTRMEDVKEKLTFDAIKGANASADAVTRDLPLVKELDGVQIAWEVQSITPAGTHAAIDTETGAVQRPNKDEQDVQVVLKANLSRNTEQDFKLIPITVKKMDMDPEEYLQQIAGWLTFADFAGANQEAGQVTADLNLIRSFNGADLVWTSGDPKVISNAGKVTQPIYPEPAVKVTLTAALSYHGTGNAVKTFTVTVQPGVPANLAQSGGIKSNISGLSTADLDRLLDEDETTYVEIPARSKSFYLIFDLKEQTPVSRLEYTEAAEEPAASGFTVEISDNGINWTQVYTGTGTAGQNVAEFAPTEARYVRLHVTEKAAGRACRLTEAAVRFWPSDQALVKADAGALVLDVPSVITAKTISLPLTGKFGSEIVWSCKPAELICETSTPGEYTVTHGSANQAVTLTATFRSGGASEQKRSSHTISGTGGGGGSFGGGGGGSSVSTGSGSQASNPKIPQQTEQPEQQGTGIFRDLGQAEWARTYIDSLCADGIVQGKADGLFQPLDPVTREEFVKMLVLSLGLDPADGALDRFRDTDGQAWYMPYLVCAVRDGIVNGLSDDTFGIGVQITREDMAVMIARAVEAQAAGQDGTRFADWEEIADYARDSVAALADMGLIQGDENGRFLPKAFTSRAEAAKVLYLLREAVK